MSVLRRRSDPYRGILVFFAMEQIKENRFAPSENSVSDGAHSRGISESKKASWRWHASYANWLKLMPELKIVDSSNGRLDYLTLSWALESNWFVNYISNSERFGALPMGLVTRMRTFREDHFSRTNDNDATTSALALAIDDIRLTDPKRPKLHVGHSQLKRLVRLGASGSFTHRGGRFRDNCRILLRTQFWEAICSFVRLEMIARRKRDRDKRPNEHTWFFLAPDQQVYPVFFSGNTDVLWSSLC